MSGIPIGYLFGALVAATIAYLALWPRPTNGPRVTPALVLAMSGSEIPFLFLALNLFSTIVAVADGTITSPIAWLALALSVLAVVGQLVVIGLATRTLPALAEALRNVFGTTRLPRRARWQDWLRAVVVPLHLPRRDVERIDDLPYGPHGRANLLDLYRSRTPRPAKGVLIQLHGGGFFSGHKSKEARLLMERFAADGWLCLSANYRLRPAAFPDQVIDAKRAIAWARAHAADYGGDAGTVALVGGSAGSHVAVICALTGNDPRFQPGFEDADTHVAAVIGLYGYYGPSPSHGMPSAPEDYLASAASGVDQRRTDIPPIMIIHGDRDPMVDPGMARDLAASLRTASAAPVVYAELPGAHHTLDRFDSLRCAGVVDGVEEFLRRALHRSADGV